MIVDIKKLINYIGEPFFVYGTGNYASGLMSKLEQTGNADRVKAFITTEGSLDSFHELKVYSIDEFAFLPEKLPVLVAVSKIHSHEIRVSLSKIEGLKVQFLEDYIFEDDWEIDHPWFIYNGRDKAFYLNRISSWKKCSIDVIDDGRKTDTGRAKRNSNQIVFVLGNEYSVPRQMRIMVPLKKLGYEIVILAYGKVTDEPDRQRAIENGLDFLHCECVEELMYTMMKYNPWFYYLETMNMDPSWGAVILQMKELFGKVIYTQYDLMNVGWELPDEWKEVEKYALERADACILRADAGDYLERIGIQIKKSIQYYDYCWGDIKGTGISTNDDGVLKLCLIQGYAKDLTGEYLAEVLEYDKQAKVWDILEHLEGHNVRFDMYTLLVDESVRQELEELERKYPFFKVYIGIQHELLMKKIKQYDYGCSFTTVGIPITEAGRMTLSGATGAGNIYHACIRMFDYLDCGLPIIATAYERQSEYLEKLGVLVRMNLGNLNVDYLRKHKNDYKNRIPSAMYELSCYHQITRLEQFFYSV